ncbi:MAG: hypothetical protein E6Q98_21105 [Rhodospirillaceae bacterium]|nr:MAG: hypothetical protein E6Q98_21105 [Rhodospirillaceae bacterium]
MSRVPPFHSSKMNTRRVYHDNAYCGEGQNIDPASRKAGTGGLPRCIRCAELPADNRPVTAKGNPPQKK